MDSWTFIIYGIIHYFFIYLIAPTVSILTTGSWQWNHWFQHPFDMLPSFWGLPLPLPSDITIWSMLILYIFGPSLRTGCFSKNPVSVCWRMVLKTKIWVLGMLIANGMSLLSKGHPSFNARKIWTQVRKQNLRKSKLYFNIFALSNLYILVKISSVL